ncbi:MAG TPA: hypothetical protein VI172_16115 [Candidatus Dormibacteraeota bacterium]|jgi:hypothetical protein
MTQQFIKKIGEPHAIDIQVELTEEQRAERRKRACDLLDQKSALVEEKKLKAAEYGQRIKELDRAATQARQAASTGTETAAVVVQNYLTVGNEVVSVRLLDNEPVVKRTATGEELQEELFGGSDDGDSPH